MREHHHHRCLNKTTILERKAPNSWFVCFFFQRVKIYKRSRHNIFLLSMHNGIFDATLTARAIGINCQFPNPFASALKPFSNPHSYCVLSDPIHWVTEPVPPDEDHNISFFTGNLCYSGTITPTTFWAFMTIHNSQSHYHIVYLVTNQHFVLLKKVSFPL